MPDQRTCARCSEELEVYKGLSYNPDAWEYFCDCPEEPVVDLSHGWVTGNHGWIIDGWDDEDDDKT